MFWIELQKSLIHLLLVNCGSALIGFSPLPKTAHIISQSALTMLPDIEDVPLLKRRLIEAGVPDSEIQFEVDHDWERLSLLGGCPEEKKESMAADVVEIKTLVWEISCIQNRMTINEVPNRVLDKFYVVTAQKVSDRVDISLLRDLVFKHHNLPLGCTPSRLSIAPTDKAETLTGFRSGCMPPVAHSVPMTLFIDASVASISEFSTASIGSGILGKSLLLPLQQFLNVAESNEHGFHVGSFIQHPSDPSCASSLTQEIDTQFVGSVEAQKSRLAMVAREQAKQRRIDSRPEPKDRLKEYRSFHKLVYKAKLLRTTARKKGRFEDMQKLVGEAVAMNEFPDLFKVSPDDGLDKNALHLSAWRGDIETVQMLVETAKKICPELDVVNIISKGHGNYGKTPIFFALTQCRDDVVRYLISEGASLLHVNNKGQTPCSIAVSHLEKESLDFLCKIESQQLREGGCFINYRATHSDNKLYGDLDPRFPIDPTNLGEANDLETPLKEFRHWVDSASSETIYNGIPTVFSPRSIRPTVRWWKRDKAGQKTFLQPRELKTRKPEEVERKSARVSSLAAKDIFEEVADLNSLETLTVDEFFNSSTMTNHASNERSTLLIDSAEALRQLQANIDLALKSADDQKKNEGKTVDEILVNSAWGLDCEWKPGIGCGVDHPVATLQLSTQKLAYLIDLQCICQETYNLTEEELKSVCPTDIEKQLCCVLEKLFISSQLPLLGYGILQDIQKLSASFPHLSCFSQYHSVIDLQSVSTAAFPKPSRQAMSSLQKMVAIFLERRLDKTHQCSDWTIRPLLSQQVDYATLDAAVLPTLLEKIISKSSVIERYNGQFFAIHSNLKSSVRFSTKDKDGNPLDVLDVDGNEITYNVPMGRIKNVFSRNIARQSWASNQSPPDFARKIALQLPLHKEIQKVPSKKERAHLRKVGDPDKKKPKPIQLKSLLGNLQNLPIPGITLGYTKDSCVHRVIGHEFMNTLPEGTHIGFNRRSGVVETSNAWIIFCNFGYFTSGFLRGGRELSFNVNPLKFNGKSSEKTLLDYVSSPRYAKVSDDKKILLFARNSTREKYTYCGICRCKEMFSQESGSVDLLLNLMDFENLTEDNKFSSDFLNLVENQEDYVQIK